jgi:ABC-2 type transport system permease protein
MTDSAPDRSARRDTSRTLSFGTAARGVYDVSLEGLLWSRRTAFLGILLLLPVALSLLYRVAAEVRAPRIAGFDLYGKFVAVYYVRNVVPLVALFYATSLIADEVEGKTLTYLLSRPIQRSSILVGKLLAYLVTTLSLTLPAIVVSFFVLATAQGSAGLGGHIPDLLGDLGAVALGLAVYGALFTLLGVVLRRPMIVGLLFLFGWELLVYLPGYLPRLTITGYLRSLVSYHPMQGGLFGALEQTLPAGQSVLTLVILCAVLVAAAVAAFAHREYVMEQ